MYGLTPDTPQSEDVPRSRDLPAGDVYDQLFARASGLTQLTVCEPESNKQRHLSAPDLHLQSLSASDRVIHRRGASCKHPRRNKTRSSRHPELANPGHPELPSTNLGTAPSTDLRTDLRLVPSTSSSNESSTGSCTPKTPLLERRRSKRRSKAHLTVDVSEARDLQQRGSAGFSHPSEVAEELVLVLGAPRVGKSSLMAALRTATPRSIQSPSTPTTPATGTGSEGTEQFSLALTLDDNESHLRFCVAEQLEGVQVAAASLLVLIYSAADRLSLVAAEDTLRLLRHGHASTLRVVLLENKTDLVRARQVTRHEAEEVASRYCCSLVRVSCALGLPTERMLHGLVRLIRTPHSADQPSTGCLGRTLGGVVKDKLSKLFRTGSKGRRNKAVALYNEP